MLSDIKNNNDKIKINLVIFFYKNLDTVALVYWLSLKDLKAR
jgi:hypothetical protein